MKRKERRSKGMRGEEIRKEEIKGRIEGKGKRRGEEGERGVVR